MYCETPSSLDGGFPLEPFNVWSSAIIVVFGILATLMVARQAPRAWPLYLACALLMVNGVGSMLWHGLRTRWANTLDVVPALIFVALIALLWARRVAPLWQQVAIVALPLVFFLPRYLGIDFDPRVFLEGVVPISSWAFSRALVVTICTIWLVALTLRLSPKAALTGSVALILALVALTARSLDEYTCATYGIGSHPLWHVFLSAGAFMAVRTLVKLEALKRPAAPLTLPASPAPGG